MREFIFLHIFNKKDLDRQHGSERTEVSNDPVKNIESSLSSL